MSNENNFGLSVAEFNQLAAQLADGDIQLFEQIFLSHFEFCMLYVINKYSASRDEAYDCTMDTLLDFRQKIIDGKVKYGNLRFLFTRMAGNRYVDVHYRKNREKSLEKVEIAVEENYLAFDENIEDILESVWDELGNRCKELLKQHYYQGMKLTEIAIDKGSNAPLVRKQKQRCIERLRELFIRTYKGNV